MARPSAKPVVRIDDGRVIATEWQFAPGAETGWHIHGHDYVVVPLTDGDLLLEEPGGGTRDAGLKRHAPYARRAGVEHNVVNAGDTDLAFLEVEIVDRPLDAARLSTLSRFMNAWNARDVDALMHCMTNDCAFRASGGPGAEGRRYEGASSVRAAYQAIFDDLPRGGMDSQPPPRHRPARRVGMAVRRPRPQGYQCGGRRLRPVRIRRRADPAEGLLSQGTERLSIPSVDTFQSPDPDPVTSGSWSGSVIRWMIAQVGRVQLRWPQRLRLDEVLQFIAGQLHSLPG